MVNGVALFVGGTRGAELSVRTSQNSYTWHRLFLLSAVFSPRPSPHRLLLWMLAETPVFLVNLEVFGRTRVIGSTNSTTGQLVLRVRA